jgi:hypothetical protein
VLNREPSGLYNSCDNSCGCRCNTQTAATAIKSGKRITIVRQVMSQATLKLSLYLIMRVPSGASPRITTRRNPGKSKRTVRRTTHVVKRKKPRMPNTWSMLCSCPSESRNWPRSTPYTRLKSAHGQASAHVSCSRSARLSCSGCSSAPLITASFMVFSPCKSYCSAVGKIAPEGFQVCRMRHCSSPKTWKWL